MSETDLTTLLADHAADVGPISGYWKCACGAQSDNTRAAKGGPMPTDRRAEYRAHLADAIVRAGLGPARTEQIAEDMRDAIADRVRWNDGTEYISVTDAQRLARETR